MDDPGTNREDSRMKQFSIRDLLFFVVIVALVLGWWFDRRAVPARFQMHSVPPNGNAYILDTSTGQAWNSSQTDFYQQK